jgi:anti-anti-sigma regulatory factor
MFRQAVTSVLDGGARRVVIDLTRSHLSDDSVASAAPEAYHKARAVGADMRFVVMPGRAGGYYHMAGLELAIPTYHRLGGAIDF